VPRLLPLPPQQRQLLPEQVQAMLQQHLLYQLLIQAKVAIASTGAWHSWRQSCRCSWIMRTKG
jgi:hypothetical protein